MKNLFKMLAFWLSTFNQNFEISTKKSYSPSYCEVFTTLTSIQIDSCLIAYEVLCLKTASRLQKNLAIDYLYKIADSHNWNHDIFMDIIDEEYGCLHFK